MRGERYDDSVLWSRRLRELTFWERLFWWNWELEPGAGTWSWNLELEPGAGTWNWNLELEPEAGARSWNLELVSVAQLKLETFKM